MGKVIGQNIYMTKRYLQDKKDERTYEKVISKMPEDSRKVVENMIDVKEWYDAKVLSDLMEAIMRVLGNKEMKALGEYTLDNQVKFFGFMLKFMSIETVASRAAEMWKKVYSEGECVVTEITDNTVTVTVEDFTFTDAFALGFTYWIETLIERVSGKNVTGQYKKINSKKSVFNYIIRS